MNVKTKKRVILKLLVKPLAAALICLPCFVLISSCGVGSTEEKDPISKEPAKEIAAQKVSDFLNSIGVNSAVSKRGESLDKTIEITKYLGIRWIRSGYEGDANINDLLKLHSLAGIRYSYGLLSGGTDIPRLLEGGKKLAAAGALLAFEGLNEPNNWGITYQGKQGGKELSWMPIALLQKDLYQSVKNDPELKAYPVWSLSETGAQTENVGLQFLEIPKGAGTLMADGTKYADYANCHNYIMHPSSPGLYDNQTWNAADPSPASKVDGLFGNYGITWRKHHAGYSENDLSTLPRVTTETGAKIEGDLTEDKQARLFLNLYLAQFKRGWSFTALYLLRDRTDESGNQRYGFYGRDYAPRKSALYLHNLTTILADKESTIKTEKLTYSIENQPETVHDLLLQKSNGNFELVVWGEKISGSDHVKINLGSKHANVKIYDPTIGTTATQALNNVDSISLTLSDHPVIIEIVKS